MTLQTLSWQLFSHFRREHYEAPPGTTHVLSYCPAALAAHPAPAEGWWEIQALADHSAGTPAAEPASIEGPAGLDWGVLAGFAARTLGHPVALTPFSLELMAAEDYPDGEWLPAPGYYLTPAGGDR